MKKVLTIAGSDSGGGAGIQADLKTFTARGVFGTVAITAVTAQNTLGVQGVYELPPSFVGAQIDSVMTDMGADAVKIGMLSNKKIIDVVAGRIKKYSIQRVVLDPVMIAKSGDLLINKNAQQALIKKLLPLAFVVTPNLFEAEAMTGFKITTVVDMKSAAKKIHQLGARTVVIKGGNLAGSNRAIDILYDGKKFHEFSVPRIKTRSTHGTGCTFSAVIAAELAKGSNVYGAVKTAKKYLTAWLKN